MTSFASTIGSFAASWHDWGHGGAGWWIVFMLLFWALLVGGFVLLLRSSGRWSRRVLATERESALETLERRFAEGQMSVSDYQDRRRILTGEQDED